MSDQRLFLVYDAAFDDMDAEGCPAFGYVLLFNEQDVAEYQSGENDAAQKPRYFGGDAGSLA